MKRALFGPSGSWHQPDIYGRAVPYLTLLLALFPLNNPRLPAQLRCPNESELQLQEERDKL